jgi:hypothetical protein
LYCHFSDENETEVAKLLEPIPKPNPKHGVKHGVKRPREEDEEEEEQVEAKKTKLQVDESGALVIEDDDELTVLNSNTSFMSTTEEGEPTVID